MPKRKPPIHPVPPACLTCRHRHTCTRQPSDGCYEGEGE